MIAKKPKRPEHYFYLMLIISFCHIVFMRFLFQEGWEYSSLATVLVEKVGTVVPMLRYLSKWNNYKAYWGVFYSIFWIISPIFLVLGFISTNSMSEKYTEFYKKQPRSKILLFGGFLAVLFAFVFVFPGGGSRFWFDELSGSFIVICLTVGQMAGCIFAVGLFIGILKIRSK